MVAPVLAALVTSLVSNGLNILGSAVIAKGKEAIEEKLDIKLPPDGNLSTEQLSVLKEKEAEHEQWLIEASMKLDQLYLQDKANARDLQKAALAQTDLFSKRFLYYYATFWSICSVVYIAAITFGEIPEANVRFADTILGFILGTVVSAIIQFFFGSSRSSQNKDDLVAELSKNVSQR